MRSDAVLAERFQRSLEKSRARRAQAVIDRIRRRRRVVLPRTGASLLVVAALAIASVGTTFAAAEATRSAGHGMIDSGDRGATVQAVQRALGITADGVFGPATKRAVKRFQRRRGLTVDGVVGPQTLAALGLRIAPASRRSAPSSTLQRIAQCESGGNPGAVSPDGRYRGKYQFSRETWRSLGGKGDPARAAEAEQDRLAAKLYRMRGGAPWPNCS